jgi:3-oxoadipate enol-lactonase
VARVHLGGASLGSFVALWVAQNHPDRVARLILEGVGARAGTPEAWRERAETVRSQGMAAIASTVVSRWLPADFAAEHPAVHSALLDALLATPVEGYVGCCAAIEAMDLAADLGLVTAPTLVIAGGEDQSVSPEFGRAVAAGITGAEFELIAGAAHLPNISHPDRVSHLMLDFLTA